MFGIYGVAFSLLAIAIAAKSFSRGERWAWWALLVGKTIAFGAPMMYDQIVRAVGPFELSEYLGPGDLRGPSPSPFVLAPVGRRKSDSPRTRRIRSIRRCSSF